MINPERKNPLKLSKYILLLLACLVTVYSKGQKKMLALTLGQTIELAQSDAPDALLARTQLSNNYWQFRSFQADFKPQVGLDATLPNLNRSIDPITLPDGTDQFIARSLMTNSFNVSLRQRIASTGGVVFASTGLRRIDILSSNTISYLSTPIVIGFTQPIFAFNSMKWSKKIEPLRFDEAKRAFSEDLEAVAAEAARLFFDVYIAQLSVEAAQLDRFNADTLYNIARGRFSVGKIAETDLLQVEISKMNADASLAQATLDLQTSTENLRNFLGIKDPVDFNLIPPTEIPNLNIDPEIALKHAVENRQEILRFQRRELEAERDVARAKGENGLNIDLFGQVGLTQTGSTLGEAFVTPLDQEQINLRLTVPIVDWGKAESERQIAQSNEKLVKMQVEQDRINFEQTIRLRVRQFDLVKNQAKLAEKTYEVSQKNFDLTKKRYLIGKIGVTDLNLAIADQQRSRQGYMNTLRAYWLAYYEIRRLTLFDFLNNQTLSRKPTF